MNDRISEEPETLRIYRHLKQTVQELGEVDEYSPSAWKAMARHMARLFGDLDMLLTLGGPIPHEWVVGADLSPEDN
ncbi:hypothetical protein [Streptomyces luteogriseus]|uniref:hypothetical protein n=1 Tax=Streptomyces luteogriseus TaxID=68233 RepID=UPI0037A9E631